MSIEPLPRSDGLLIQRSRQYTYCAVVSIPAGTEVKKEEVPFEFSLLKSNTKYLSREANNVLEYSYKSLPVHSQVPYNKYLAAHALNYCDSQKNNSYKVYTCQDTPPFLLTIETVRHNKASVADKVLGLWPLGLLLSLFIIVLLYDTVLNSNYVVKT